MLFANSNRWLYRENIACIQQIQRCFYSVVALEFGSS